MQPIAIITGILLGTSLSIGLGLSVVLLLFSILMDDHPRLASEFPALLASAGIFVVMTAICAISFVGILRHRSWRWYSQVVMWSGVVMTVFYYLPDK
jgi:arginine exporter protein ArgO